MTQEQLQQAAVLDASEEFNAAREAYGRTITRLGETRQAHTDAIQAHNAAREQMSKAKHALLTAASPSTIPSITE